VFLVQVSAFTQRLPSDQHVIEGVETDKQRAAVERGRFGDEFHAASHDGFGVRQQCDALPVTGSGIVAGQLLLFGEREPCGARGSVTDPSCLSHSMKPPGNFPMKGFD
jgi:hypothetical protein